MRNLSLWDEKSSGEILNKDHADSESSVNGIVNVASVRKLSPFRYPGGKTWLVPEVRAWLRQLPFRPVKFIEPFAGGAIVALTAVFENLVDHAVLCECDEQVAALWQLVFSDGEWLADKILSFEMNRQNVEEALAKNATLRDRGFRTLILNRVHRGGILAPGASMMKDGENGKGLASRWYPATLAKRILEICHHRERFTFVKGDAFPVLLQYGKACNNAFFVDPPYTIGGKRAGSRLYLHNQIDHDLLFRLLSKVKGKFLATYDDAPEVEALSRKYGFSVRKVLMKNTHHQRQFELLITRG
ncbi:DNA adenine methylase [bacterium]|nr:DNA adenine methylase [bacterium]